MLALEAWASSEGVDPAANNPLAASDKAPGSRTDPAAPAIQMYVSIAQAVSVYVGKLDSALYSAIGDALKGDKGLATIWQAINQSPWCKGCQGGKYPIALYDQATPGTVQPPPSQGPVGTPTPVLPPPTAGPVGTPQKPTVGFGHGPQAWHDLQVVLGKHVPTRSRGIRAVANLIRPSIKR